MSTLSVVVACIFAGAVGIAAYMWNNYRRKKRLQNKLLDLSDKFEKAAEENRIRREKEIERKALQNIQNAVKKANEDAAKAINLVNYLNTRDDN